MCNEIEETLIATYTCDCLSEGRNDFTFCGEVRFDRTNKYVNAYAENQLVGMFPQTDSNVLLRHIQDKPEIVKTPVAIRIRRQHNGRFTVWVQGDIE